MSVKPAPAKSIRSILSVTKLEESEFSVPESILRRGTLPKFEVVETNVYPRRKNAGKDYDKDISCECSPNKKDVNCGHQCVNRALYIECDPETCPVKERCTNMNFAKRNNAQTLVLPMGRRGWGMIAQVDIPEDTFIVEYAGKIITTDKCEREIKIVMEKMKDKPHSLGPHLYYLTLEGDKVIDASKKGTMARFINHSCDPNCKIEKWTVQNQPRQGVFSKCLIKAGEELTFDYKYELGDESYRKLCFCSKPNCTGFIGGSKPVEREASKKGKRKRKSRALEHWDDECSACQDGGKLIACDFRTEGWRCPKVFHAKCVTGLSKRCRKFICPWHECDSPGCGRTAKVFCRLCVNSWCLPHSKNVEGLLGDTETLSKTQLLATCPDCLKKPPA
eukprot:772315_1